MRPPPLNVDAAAAKLQNISTYITLDGQIAPFEQSTLAFQQSAPIIKITVNIGDVVRKGALLAQIDPSTLQAQLSQAQAQASQQHASAKGAAVGLPVQTQTNIATRRDRQSLARQCEARLRAKQTTLSSRATFRRPRYSSLKRVRASPTTYNNSVVGLRNNVVSAENVKAQQASARSAASAQANVLARSFRRRRCTRRSTA